MRESVADLLTRHAKSYNTDRSGVRYVICRCGLEMRCDGSNTADDARTFATHQSVVLMAEIGVSL